MTFDRRSILAGLGLAGFAGLGPVRAQADWPSQLIRIVVPFTPGGSTDVLARVIANRLERVIPGKGFVIENRPGAGGMTASGQVAKSEPDGHTLMMGHIGTLAFAPSLYANVPYDPVKDFQPVALVAMLPNILAINPTLPAKTLAEFIAYAKANPGKLNYSSGGQGSAAHIATAYFCHRAGIEATHVPYRGTAPSVNDIVAGNIQFTLTGGPAVLPLAEGGQLRVLGVAGRERVGFAPDLPTLSESGLPDFEAVQWYGLVAPARTPRPIVERLNREINALLGQPDFAAALARDGAIARPEPPEGFGKLIASELALWRDVITRAGIKAAE
ncbi:tripartite tricarboxylate transporter substrate binding protein [Bosea vestrisii]|uniref:Bug family tripartite tricarboxylate transporter substrate binding protein n=1 Tax=Bosea vestrisii TaxID=151416 RepID=UPI0024DF450F|nr:tripartite tricarboxylate transporter substrate binding protein [Bosea vestrisii]WID98462.1 tripartite tricarboxylate transporter substrate binding protein [Bosea vestrisii]